MDTDFGQLIPGGEAGYRLQCGTASGAYDYTVDVWKDTSHAAQGLELKAYDNSGSVSDPSVAAGSVWC